jgi:hypothetical protein
MIKYLVIISFLFFASCKNNRPANSTVSKDSSSNSAVPAPVTAQSGSSADSLEKSNNPTPSTGNSGSIKKNGEVKPETMRLVIEFYSIASGIDNNALMAYEDSLGAYSGRLGKNIDYLKKNYGREGETEICLRLTELNTAEQKDFIAFTRKMLKNAKWVNINENALCRH